MSSQKHHHLIACQGKPLYPVTLEERTSSNREVCRRTARALRALSRRSNLSKDFKSMTEDLVPSEEVEGVDKSIGDDTSQHSSGGSYDPNRKYYILNIDNTENATGTLTQFNNKQMV